MKERPIPMSAPMVKAILAGTKSQTRRVVRYAAPDLIDADGWPLRDESADGAGEVRAACPYGIPGDRLWVREAWSTLGIYDGMKPSDMAPYFAGTIRYKADGHQSGKLRPGMFMPRWASRILLEITDVRVERLQEISENDAIAEGIERLPRLEGYGLPDGSHFHVTDPRISYRSLWDAINGQGAVEANPWVWCVSFKRISSEGVTE